MFNLKPIIIGENNLLTETRNWLTNNLPLLKEMGYEYFGIECNSKLQLEEIIENTREVLESNKSLLDEKTIKNQIEITKRTVLIQLIRDFKINYKDIDTKTSQDLLAFFKKCSSHEYYSDIVKSINHEEEKERAVYNKVYAQHLEKKALLHLLLNLQELGFKCINLNANSGENETIKHTKKPSFWNKDSAHKIAKKIAIAAQMCDGGIITLSSLNDLAAIAENLEKVYNENSLLKARKNDLKHFSFLRVYDSDLVENTERLKNDELQIQETVYQIESKYSWFCARQIEYSDTTATEQFLNSLYVKEEENERNDTLEFNNN